MTRLIIASAVALAAMVTLAAAPSHAYKLGGKQWPKRTITYHSATPQYAEAIDAAVRAWNTSGVRVRFKAVPRSRAKLLIVYSASASGPIVGPSGHATLGWTPVLTYKQVGGIPLTGNIPCGGRARLPDGKYRRVRCFERGPQVWLDRVPLADAQKPEIKQQMAEVVAHELGHSLGLRHHHSRCAIMSYERLDRCTKAEPWQVRCRLLEQDDVAGAIFRYGGRARPLAQEFCGLYTPPAAPTGLAATFDPERREITATWVNSSSPEAAHLTAVVLKGECATSDGPFGAPFVPATPGAPGGTVEYVGDDSGPHCVTVWASDGKARPGPVASTWIDVPPLV